MLSIAMMLSLSQCVTVDDGGYYPGSYGPGYRGHGGHGSGHDGYRHDGRGRYGRGSGYGEHGRRYENHYDNDDDHDAENYYPQGSRGRWRPSTPYTPSIPYRY